jgi:hypothetical protein
MVMCVFKFPKRDTRLDKNQHQSSLKGKYFKGQLIPEHICGVLNFSKKATNITRISALASKMGRIYSIVKDSSALT